MKTAGIVFEEDSHYVIFLVLQYSLEKEGGKIFPITSYLSLDYNL